MRIPYGFIVTGYGEFVVEESAANNVKQMKNLLPIVMLDEK